MIGGLYQYSEDRSENSRYECNEMMQQAYSRGCSGAELVFPVN